MKARPLVLSLLIAGVMTVGTVARNVTRCSVMSRRNSSGSNRGMITR